MSSLIKDCFWQIILIVLTVSTLQADPPGISYIFPAGAQQGTTVDVRIGGFNLFDEAPLEFLSADIEASANVQRLPKTLWFEGPRIAMPASQAKEDYPVDNQASLKVADNAQIGTHYWRVWTSQGIVPAQSFVIGNLPEVIEAEIDGTAVPEKVDLPVTINGRIFPREDVDLWQFDAVRGQSYTVEVMSSRLGYPLDSRIEVIDPQGESVAQNVDHFENDSFLRFEAQADGLHHVRIHDSQFGGLQNYVYRLTITDQQVIDHVFPLGGKRGTRVSLQLSGQKTPSTTHPVLLDSTTDVQSVTMPGGQQVALEVSDYPEFIFHHSRPIIEFPAVLNGKIAEAGRRESWMVRATEGQTIEFDLRAARLGSNLDSILEIYDMDDVLLASNDDIGKGNTDSYLKYTFKAAGTFQVVVSDRFKSRGGENFGYRVVCNEPSTEKKFSLSLPASELTLTRKATAKIKVTAVRSGGLTEEIQLEFRGLPAGVTIEGNTIAKGKSDTDVTLTCDELTKISTYELEVIGRAEILSDEVQEGEEPKVAETLEATADWKGFRRLKLAIAIATPFKLFGTFDTNYAHRGSTFKKTLYIERTGYDGPIEIAMSDRQIRHLQGVTGGKVIVPAGATQYEYAIQLAPWMQPGRTARMVVCGAATITDHDGTKHRVSHSSGAQNDQIICFISPSLSSITSMVESARFEPGKNLEVPFTVNRGELKGEVLVEVVMPTHLKGVSATPVSVAANNNSGVIHIQFADTKNIVVNAPIVLRATIRDAAGMHTAEDKIDLVR